MRDPKREYLLYLRWCDPCVVSWHHHMHLLTGAEHRPHARCGWSVAPFSQSV